MRSLALILWPNKWKFFDTSTYAHDLTVIWQHKENKTKFTKQKLRGICSVYGGISIQNLHDKLSDDSLAALDLEDLEIKDKRNWKFWQKNK